MRRFSFLYGGVVVLFGGVVLWASDAPAGAAAIAAGTALLLLLAAAMFVRPAPTLLVVGEREGEDLEALHRELQQVGFGLEMCPGPENSACPVLSGKPCPAHGEPVAAIVIRHPDETEALAPCGEAFKIAELAVEEDSSREPELVGRYGRVGLERGTEAVSDALERLLAGTSA